MSEATPNEHEKAVDNVTAQNNDYLDPELPSQKSLIDSPAPRQLHGLLWGIVVTSVLSAIFLFALDNTVVALIQPRIVNSLGEIEKLPWLSVSFALTSVAMNLIWYSTVLWWSFDMLMLCHVQGKTVRAIQLQKALPLRCFLL